MAGRKALVLVAEDINSLTQYTRQLPFKRKVQQRYLDMIATKKSMADLSEDDLNLAKKCRYEMNAHQKQMAALALIKAQSSHSRFEREILDLAARQDIDAYFLLLDGLKAYLKNVDQKKAENKLRNDKQRMDQKLLSPQIQARKQRDRENYFLGASFRKLMEVTGLFEGQHDLEKLCGLVATARFTQILIQEEKIDTQKYERLLAQHDPQESFKKAVQQIIEDPRNPYVNK